MIRTGKGPSLRISLVAGFGGHEFVELGVLGEDVHEGHQSTAILQKATAGVGIGDVAELLLGDIEELGQLGPVVCGLIQHDYHLGVGEHGAALNGIQQILHVLGDGAGMTALLAKLAIGVIEEQSALLVFKDHMELVDDEIGGLTLLGVGDDTVEHGIGNGEKSCGLQLIAKVVDVVADKAVAGVHIGLVGEYI